MLAMMTSNSYGLMMMVNGMKQSGSFLGTVLVTASNFILSVRRNRLQDGVDSGVASPLPGRHSNLAGSLWIGRVRRSPQRLVVVRDGLHSRRCYSHRFRGQQRRQQQRACRFYSCAAETQGSLTVAAAAARVYSELATSAGPDMSRSSPVMFLYMASTCGRRGQG